MNHGMLTAGLLAVFALTVGSPVPAETGPLRGADELILVIAETDSATKATLGIFDRAGAGWKARESWPVVIGRTGLAWGRGLHRESDRVPGEPVKREGDGKAPAGAFALTRAFGYRSPDSVRTGLPYIESTPDIICVDDTMSPFYNRAVSIVETGLDPSNLPSHESMLRPDALYRYVAVIEHNTRPVERGAGSCIFLHVWRGPESVTAGCTAMEEPRMESLLAWLDAAKRPVIVQLTRTGYERLKPRWGLPER